jgi:hypothetical protein
MWPLMPWIRALTIWNDAEPAGAQAIPSVKGDNSSNFSVRPLRQLTRITSSRNEISERSCPLVDAMAATTIDRRLCVVIEQFYQK